MVIGDGDGVAVFCRIDGIERAYAETEALDYIARARALPRHLRGGLAGGPVR